MALQLMLDMQANDGPRERPFEDAVSTVSTWRRDLIKAGHNPGMPRQPEHAPNNNKPSRWRQQMQQAQREAAANPAPAPAPRLMGRQSTTWERAVTVWIRVMQITSIQHAKIPRICSDAIVYGMRGRVGSSRTMRCKVGGLVAKVIAEKLAGQGCKTTTVRPKKPWHGAFAITTMPVYMRAAVYVSLVPLQEGLALALKKKGIDAQVVAQWQEVSGKLAAGDALADWTNNQACAFCEKPFGLARWRRNCCRCGASCCRDCGDRGPRGNLTCHQCQTQRSKKKVGDSWWRPHLPHLPTAR